jgi:hypothetical protein
MSSKMAPDNPRIQLARMSQQAAIRKPEDDWTGTTDRTERRKLQNRLNQRTYRMFLLSPHDIITTDLVRDATAGPKCRQQGTAPQQQNRSCTTELHSYPNRPK